ncbi:MAG: class II aldolase/adducin family protein [Proteobacteria bacterium]|nr:class II aldolase/adducin family protein [Pseudomonadota bacterium]
MTPNSRLTKVSEQEVRVDLAACYRLVAHYGWDDLVFTHISARVPGTNDQFLINPFGLLFHEITASSLIKVNLQAEKIDDSPYTVNPAGFTIHSAVHQVRHDAACVLHLHTINGTAVSADPLGLLPLNQTALLIREDIAYHEYEGVAIDHDERPRLQRDLGDKNLMLLWNHGTLSLGASVAEAFVRMYYLERACSMQVATLSALAGRPAKTLLDGVANKTAALGRDPELAKGTALKLAWPALLRLLDQKDPSFRQ